MASSSSDERRRAWDVLTQWAGWAGPACLVWVGMMQRQVDRLEAQTAVEVRSLREATVARDTAHGDVLAQLRNDLQLIRSGQAAGFDEVKQRLAKVEARLDAREPGTPR